MISVCCYPSASFSREDSSNFRPGRWMLGCWSLSAQQGKGPGAPHSACRLSFYRNLLRPQLCLVSLALFSVESDAHIFCAEGLELTKGLTNISPNFVLNATFWTFWSLRFQGLYGIGWSDSFVSLVISPIPTSCGLLFQFFSALVSQLWPGHNIDDISF